MMEFYDEVAKIANNLISSGLIEYEKTPRNDDKLHKFFVDAILIIRNCYIGEIITKYSKKIENEYNSSSSELIAININFIRKILFTLKFIYEFFEIIEEERRTMHKLTFCKHADNEFFLGIMHLCRKTYYYTIDLFEIKNAKQFDSEKLRLREKIYDIDDIYLLFEHLMKD
jgi:hypothetical protein